MGLWAGQGGGPQIKDLNAANCFSYYNYLPNSMLNNLENLFIFIMKQKKGFDYPFLLSIF